MSPHHALVEQHWRRADHNLAAYAYLAQGWQSFNDWQITTLFYAALHYVNAYFASQGSSVPQSHRDRNFLVAKNSNLRPVAGDYDDLYYWSRQARYTSARLPNANDLYDVDLVRLRRHISRLIDPV